MTHLELATRSDAGGKEDVQSYFVRASLVFVEATAFHPITRQIERLTRRCTGLRIGSLHQNLSCHHLRRYSDDGRVQILTVRDQNLIDSLPKCPKCFGGSHDVAACEVMDERALEDRKYEVLEAH